MAVVPPSHLLPTLSHSHTHNTHDAILATLDLATSFIHGVISFLLRDGADLGNCWPCIEHHYGARRCIVAADDDIFLNRIHCFQI
ncbi:uncharacterized protein DS421_18g616000 [Arachis hypogaea]|nr:uncharacterized protein DS421_18g616000 [Arachis hypogaea]